MSIVVHLYKLTFYDVNKHLKLFQAFVGNQAACLKVQPKQIERIVAMIGEHQENVPELLELLCAIVKVHTAFLLRSMGLGFNSQC